MNLETMRRFAAACELVRYTVDHGSIWNEKDADAILLAWAGVADDVDCDDGDLYRTLTAIDLLRQIPVRAPAIDRAIEELRNDAATRIARAFLGIGGAEIAAAATTPAPEAA